MYGAGRHLFYILTELGPEKLILALKLNLTTQIIYVFALTFAKFSVGLFLLRLTPSGWVRKLIWGMLALVGLWTVAGSSALMASCTPFAATFDRTIPNHRCYPPQTARALAYTNSCKNNSHSCHRCENGDSSCLFQIYSRLTCTSYRHFDRCCICNASDVSLEETPYQQQNQGGSYLHT